MSENRLEDLREEKNLKSKDMAKILNVNPSTYSEWEHNKISIPTRRIIQLSNYYKINIDYLLKLSNKKKIQNSNIEIELYKIGNRLKEARKDLKFSLRELGEKLNCSYSSLGSYERGEHLINCNILISLSLLTNYSIDWLLGNSNEKTISK